MGLDPPAARLCVPALYRRVIIAAKSCRADLKMYPKNMWGLLGLHQCLEKAGKGGDPEVGGQVVIPSSVSTLIHPPLVDTSYSWCSTALLSDNQREAHSHTPDGCDDRVYTGDSKHVPVLFNVKKLKYLLLLSRSLLARPGDRREEELPIGRCPGERQAPSHLLLRQSRRGRIPY